MASSPYAVLLSISRSQYGWPLSWDICRMKTLRLILSNTAPGLFAMHRAWGVLPFSSVLAFVVQPPLPSRVQSFDVRLLGLT